MLKYILSALMNSGVGDQFDGGTGGDLASLTSALKAEKDKKSNPMDRLSDAFKQLKDMHKDNAPVPAPFNFESAQWPYGPVGAPSQAQASVPMPQSRPPEAKMGLAPYDPHGSLSEKDANSIYDSFEASPAGQRMRSLDQKSPFADFFARNTAMMQDPNGGGYIDPSAAAKQGPGILNGLFG